MSAYICIYDMYYTNTVQQYVHLSTWFSHMVLTNPIQISDLSLTPAPLGRQRTGPNLLASTAVAGYNTRGRCSCLGGWDADS